MSGKQTKPKQKKADAHIELERKCQELMSQLIDKENMLKKSQEKCSRMGIDLHESRTQALNLRNYIKDEFEKLQLTNQNLKSRVTELTGDKNQLEIQVATLRAKLEFQRKQHQDWRREKEKEFEDTRRHYATEIGKYELQANEYIISINEKQAMTIQRAQLLEMIEVQRQEFKRKLADRERQKIQAIDALKKEMKDKFNDMKNNLLSIRREQLDNNTRLTLLQNHQLIQELEYQSSNTEKVVDKNIEMERRIKELEAELQIREEVQKEIAKRSTVSKKILKAFQDRAQSLQKENEELHQKMETDIQKHRKQDNTNKKAQQLVKNLQTAHRKIQIIQKQLALKSAQLQQSTKAIDDSSLKIQKMAKLLCQYYDQSLFDSKGHLGQQIDLVRLKKIDVKEWKPHQIQLIVTNILNQLKPFLSSQQLDPETWRKIADSRIPKLAPQDKENLIDKQLKVENKCDSAYIKSISLEKNKLFYHNKRKISGHKERSLTKLSSTHEVSFGRYVQTNLREWGPSLNKDIAKSLAQRFMKPSKNKVK